MNSKVTFGRLVADKWRWGIDAQPHVMARVRNVFRTGVSVGRKGIYTHSPVQISKSIASAKDLHWFMDRYPLEVEDDVLLELENMALEHDRRQAMAHDADKCIQLLMTHDALKPAYPPYDHQNAFRNFAMAVRRTLLADPLAAGKTESALLCAIDKADRPAWIICQPHLCSQWQKRVHKFLPEATTHVIKSGKKEIPIADFVIVSYTMLRNIEDKIPFWSIRTLIMDEVQELRKHDTEKRRVARKMSEAAETVIGASATPIYNMAGEIWSVIDAIAPGQLGDKYSFMREWTNGDGFSSQADALGTYLRSVGLMIRRDIRSKNRVTRDVITLDADLKALNGIQDITKLLALSVLSNRVGENSASELDWRLRQATGIAKAVAAAAFVTNIVNMGEKVLLAGWHREVYAIWQRQFKLHNIRHAFITGSETPAQKEAAKTAFMDGNIDVLILSLRSGAGIDGLQHVCHNVVFGELDWSPHVHDQIIGRLDRPGQQHPVQAYYLNVDDGSDPFIINLLGVKRNQHDALIDGELPEGVILGDVSPGVDRMRELAKAVLEQMGVEVPTEKVREGLMGEAVNILRAGRVRQNSEADQQRAVESLLANLKDATVTKEAVLDERSRIDFLIERGNERVGIECKITQTSKSATYRQVRRYIECGLNQIILVAPWSGVPDFEIDGADVAVIDMGRSQL